VKIRTSASNGVDKLTAAVVLRFLLTFYRLFLYFLLSSFCRHCHFILKLFCDSFSNLSLQRLVSDFAVCRNSYDADGICSYIESCAGFVYVIHLSNKRDREKFGYFVSFSCLMYIFTIKKLLAQYFI